MAAADTMVAPSYDGPCRRLQLDRRSCDHATRLADRRGELFNRHQSARVETLLVEQQAAAEHALEATAHAIAAAQTLMNELRAARAAAVASRRAAHLAAGAISGCDRVTAAPTFRGASESPGTPGIGRRGARPNTEAAPTSDGQGDLDEQEDRTVNATEVRLECPACVGEQPDSDTVCVVCADTGHIAPFGDEHALHQAGGPVVTIDGDRVEIRVPAHARHPHALGMNVPLATFRWIVHEGSLALGGAEPDVRVVQR